MFIWNIFCSFNILLYAHANLKIIKLLRFKENSSKDQILYYKDLFTHKDINTYINGVV